ncbi:MAG: glycine cleavage system protein [Chloroflexi bacterium]|jgi:glycine cleavage system H protein|nr:glycine cleavage system protein [Chloroflexota bacterium]
MEFPAELKYSKEHEWVRLEGDVAVIGITEFAQDELGDIVYVEQPKVGDEVRQNSQFGVVESVKTVSDLYSPVSGEVVEVNDDVTSSPEHINKDPYGAGWIIKVKVSDTAELDSLLSAADYKEMIGQ